MAEQSRLVDAGMADAAVTLMANWMVDVVQHLAG
jgi:hypothetical protein